MRGVTSLHNYIWFVQTILLVQSKSAGVLTIPKPNMIGIFPRCVGILGLLKHAYSGVALQLFIDMYWQAKGMQKNNKSGSMVSR